MEEAEIIIMGPLSALKIALRTWQLLPEIQLPQSLKKNQKKSGLCGSTTFLFFLKFPKPLETV